MRNVQPDGILLADCDVRNVEPDEDCLQTIIKGPKEVPGYTWDDAIFLAHTLSVTTIFCTAWLLGGLLTGALRVCVLSLLYLLASFSVCARARLCVIFGVFFCVCAIALWSSFPAVKCRESEADGHGRLDRFSKLACRIKLNVFDIGFLSRFRPK